MQPIDTLYNPEGDRRLPKEIPYHKTGGRAQC